MQERGENLFELSFACCCPILCRSCLSLHKSLYLSTDEGMKKKVKGCVSSRNSKVAALIKG